MTSRWSVMWQWPALLVIWIHILILKPRLLRHKITNISWKSSYVTLSRAPVLHETCISSQLSSSESFGAKKGNCFSELFDVFLCTNKVQVSDNTYHTLPRSLCAWATEELWSCESQCQDHKLHNWKQIRSPCVASYESLCWDHYNFDRLHWRTTVMSHDARTTLRAVCLISKLPAAMILTLDNDPKTNTKKLP